MKGSITPIKSTDRILSLDILRGIALLGIALVNVLGFNASFFNFGGFYNNLTDPFQLNFYQIYISLTADKFIFLYSFLFGYGFALLYQKYGSNGKKFTQFYLRRLFYLALFGIFHILFLWAGDILFLYAVAGIILFSLRRVNSKLLAPIGFFLYFFISFWLILAIWIPLPDGLSSTCTTCLENARQVYSNSNYLEILKLRLYEYYSFRYINLLYYLPKVMGIFIFGYLASRNKLHEKVSQNRLKGLIVLAAVSCLAAVLYFFYETMVFNLLSKNSPFLNATYMGAYELMNLFLASSYILIIFHFVSFGGALLAPFAYAGRMSLTNYIMQSILFSIIFYGWGFGQFGSQKPYDLMGYALGIVIIQMILSYFWLKYHKQGPLEWMWRKLAYRH
ncbi:MAG: DUF418 domain-containing protein [Bacteroidales bacterium]|nr:DUF418 domain-containing protein [Bacteroidales bacterium]MCF8402957.1 DUF418 domain-containing protein [Bacteroidales bacterium]